jgi:hypothetical protein
MVENQQEQQGRGKLSQDTMGNVYEGQGKLGSQVQSQQPQRVTRTQRKQAQEKQQQAEYDFEQRRKQAEQIKEEKMKDKVVEYEEKYNVYRPKRYSERAWSRMRQKTKDAIMKRYKRGRGEDYYYKRGLLTIHATKTRTKTKTIPFTLEDKGDEDYSYKDVYETIPENLKEFFQTPEKVVEQKYVRIGETQSTIKEKLAYADKKIQEEKDRYKKAEERYDEMRRWAKKKRDRRGNDWYEDWKKDERKRLQREEDRMEENLEYWKGYKQGLSKGEQKLKQGTEVDFSNIDSYARDLANYEEQRKRARNEQRKDFYDKLEKGELEEDYKKLGLKEDAGYYQYQQSAKQFNKDLAYLKTLQAWSGKVGRENLPTFVQEKLSTSEKKMGFSQGEIPVYDTKGKISAVQSEFFEGSFSPDAYQGKVVEFQQKVEDAGGWDSYVEKNMQSQYDKLAIKNVPFEFKEIPSSFSGKQTIMYNAMGEPITNQRVLVATREPTTAEAIDPIAMGIGWAGEKIGQVFNFARERVHFTGEADFKAQPLIVSKTPDAVYDLDAGVMREGTQAESRLGFNKDYFKGMTLGLIEFGKRDTPTEYEKMIDYRKDLSNPAQQERIRAEKIDYLGGEGTLETFKTNLKEKYSKRYEGTFWGSDVGKELFFKDFGEDEKARQEAFEDAQVVFRETKEAQKIQEDYEKEYGVGYKELQLGMTGESMFKYDTKLALLNLEQVGLNLVGDPISVGATAGGIKLLSVGMGALPTFAKNSISLGFTTWGLKSALDPTKLGEERFLGLVTASIGAVSLAKSGLTYLKSPKYLGAVKVKAPLSLKTSAVGVDKVPILKGGKVVGYKTVYSAQKLSQVGVDGTRQVWTSKGRMLFNKYLAPLNKRLAIEHVGGKGMKSVLRFSVKPSTTAIKNVYEGVPAWQPAQYQKVIGIRGETLVKTKLSGYEKTFKWLKKYGFTDAQARAGLRYTAPRLRETWLEGEVAVGKKVGLGVFNVELRQPVIDLGGGIKTRGAKSILRKDVVGRVATPFKDPNLAKYSRISEVKIGAERIAGKPITKIDLTQGKAVVKTSDISKGFYRGYEYDWRNLDALTKEMKKLSFDLGKKSLKGKLVTLSKDGTLKGAMAEYRRVGNVDVFSSKSFTPKAFPTDYKRSILIDGSSVQKAKPFILTPAKIKKTPLWKIYETDKSTQNIKQVIKKITGSKSNVVQIFEKPRGTLMIDKQVDKVGIKMGVSGGDTQLQRMLKVAPDIEFQKTFSVAKVGAVKQVDLLGMMSMKWLMLQSGLMLKTQQKHAIKSDLQLKMMLKQDLKLKQVQAVKQQQAMKQAMQTRMAIPQLFPIVSTPSLKSPMIKTPITSKFKMPVIARIKAQRELKAKLRKRKDKKMDIFGALPDFTARALNLKPQQVQTDKDIARILKGTQTGLGIRTGATFKKRGNMTDKQLLKGIMA